MEDLSKALREVSTLSLNKLFLAWRGKVLYAIVILSVLFFFILFYYILVWDIGHFDSKGPIFHFNITHEFCLVGVQMWEVSG